MSPTLHFPGHPSEDVLENYAFRRLSEEEMAGFEEHLLVCESCQENLEAVEEFTFLMKAAAACPPPHVAVRGADWIPLPAAIENVAWGGAMGAILLALLVLAWQPRVNPTLAQVTLASFRGPEDVAIAHAPAHQPLHLSIAAADLPKTGTYRIRIVNAIGKPAWDGTLASASGKLTAVVPAGMDAGIYWVRLYTGDSELLREFGLRLD